ncbi:MAG: DUF2243 domain-containing protein [Methylacidiphilales bacterium]|nr:DUF2243 domain-containing protein [Candidatus Methylacidiphilales bacterium]NJR19875.1 DUF2243 domain-containing protein [Calothrix sp. CSU_2_0]
MEAKQQIKGNSQLLIASGIFLGLGFGGFFDGIVLHQILQWHHMLSNIKPLSTETNINVSNIDLNMVWDGLFHAFDFVLTVIGVILLWFAGKKDDITWSENTFFGSIIIGVGLFDFVEGIIDHQILGIHHVKPGVNQSAWDMGFLALGASLIAIGWIVQKKGLRE